MPFDGVGIRERDTVRLGWRGEAAGGRVKVLWAKRSVSWRGEGLRVASTWLSADCRAAEVVVCSCVTRTGLRDSGLLSNASFRTKDF